MDIREEAVQGDAKLSAKLRDEIASIVCWTEWLDWNDLNISQAEIIADALMPLVARIQADAWDEGTRHAYTTGCRFAKDGDPCPNNPYRADRQENPT